MLVDTSVLCRVNNRGNPEADACRALLQPEPSLRLDLCLCPQVIYEYWVVATRPRQVNGLGLDPQDAFEDVAGFRDSTRWLADPPDLFDRWHALVAARSVSGKLAHDARLVALMQAHGVDTLVTLNDQDFIRLGVPRCVTPAKLLQG